jgi:hypothetical protein
MKVNCFFLLFSFCLLSASFGMGVLNCAQFDFIGEIKKAWTIFSCKVPNYQKYYEIVILKNKKDKYIPLLFKSEGSLFLTVFNKGNNKVYKVEFEKKEEIGLFKKLVSNFANKESKELSKLVICKKRDNGGNVYQALNEKTMLEIFKVKDSILDVQVLPVFNGEGITVNFD